MTPQEQLERKQPTKNRRPKYPTTFLPPPTCSEAEAHCQQPKNQRDDYAGINIHIAMTYLNPEKDETTTPLKHHNRGQQNNNHTRIPRQNRIANNQRDDYAGLNIHIATTNLLQEEDETTTPRKHHNHVRVAKRPIAAHDETGIRKRKQRETTCPTDPRGMSPNE